MLSLPKKQDECRTEADDASIDIASQLTSVFLANHVQKVVTDLA
jgi:hypothetical protein